MFEALQIILSILRDAWAVIASLIAAIAVLALLVTFLKSTSGHMMGSSNLVGGAIITGAGLIMFVLFGFYGIPAMVQSIQINVPDCGPITELGQAAAMFIGAAGAVRMLLSIFSAVAMSAAGAPVELSRSIVEIGLVLLGMLAATVAVPVATAFFGAC